MFLRDGGTPLEQKLKSQSHDEEKQWDEVQYFEKGESNNTIFNCKGQRGIFRWTYNLVQRYVILLVLQ